MKRFCALLFLAALPILAAGRSLTGSWKISITVNGETHQAACTFQQDGEKLTGTCKGESGEGPVTGQVQGEKITWQHQLPYNGDTLTLSYAGTFSSDTEIKGSVNVAPYDIDGDFAGQKDAAAGGK
jgi:hypothetical protein